MVSNLVRERMATHSHDNFIFSPQALVIWKNIPMKESWGTQESCWYLRLAICYGWILRLSVKRVFLGEAFIFVFIGECLFIKPDTSHWKSYLPFHFYYVWQGTNEILRMYIALAGMQHAGKHLQEVLKWVVTQGTLKWLYIDHCIDIVRRNYLLVALDR